MQIELCILTSHPLTAPPLIVDVQSCNVIFINADCFDHSVAILCGAFPALHRRLAVTAIRNIALPSPADHTLQTLPGSSRAPHQLPSHSGGHRAQGLLKAAQQNLGTSSDPSLQPCPLATHSPLSRLSTTDTTNLPRIWDVFCGTPSPRVQNKHWNSNNVSMSPQHGLGA